MSIESTNDDHVPASVPLEKSILKSCVHVLASVPDIYHLTA